MTSTTRPGSPSRPTAGSRPGARSRRPWPFATLNGRGVSRLAFLPNRLGVCLARCPRPPGTGSTAPSSPSFKAHKIHPSESTTGRHVPPPGLPRRLGRPAHDRRGSRFPGRSGPDQTRQTGRSPADSAPEFADFWALKWADLLRNEEKAMGRERASGSSSAGSATRSPPTCRSTSSPDAWSPRPARPTSNPPDQLLPDESRSRSSADRSLQPDFPRSSASVRQAATTTPTTPGPRTTITASPAYFHQRPPPSRWTTGELDALDTHEIKGDEVVYLEGQTRRDPSQRSGERLAPKPPNGPKAKPSMTTSTPSDALADWLTVDNRQFARNMANRVWFHLHGSRASSSRLTTSANPTRRPTPLSSTSLTDRTDRPRAIASARLVALIMKSSGLWP